jgi:hypothetical protein
MVESPQPNRRPSSQTRTDKPLDQLVVLGPIDADDGHRDVANRASARNGDRDAVPIGCHERTSTCLGEVTPDDSSG